MFLMVFQFHAILRQILKYRFCAICSRELSVCAIFLLFTTMIVSTPVLLLALAVVLNLKTEMEPRMILALVVVLALILAVTLVSTVTLYW